MAKTIAGQGDTFRSTQVDDKTIVVYHHLAVGDLVYVVCGMAVDFNAGMVAATLDARQARFRVSALCISF